MQPTKTMVGVSAITALHTHEAMGNGTVQWLLFWICPAPTEPASVSAAKPYCAATQTGMKAVGLEIWLQTSQWRVPRALWD